MCEHIDKRPFRKGKCRSCCIKEGIVKLATECPHTTKIAVGNNMCPYCYKKFIRKNKTFATACKYYNRIIEAHGLCKSCYNKKGFSKKATDCEHKDQAYYAKGVC